ncbi:hypothetical protein ACFQY0_19315 [Haloferula chungangensis]|uniref:Uncharacterized protein n=1 Tax=Haloferula chungangensis TaxID=1048331 RepID=A0ABW2LCR8_9BACT
MNPIRHALHTLWIRYRWEITGFLAIVLVFSTAPSTPLEARWIGTFAMLETLGLFWLTLRILLADDGFKTHAGWQARPVHALHLLAAQLILLALITCLPLALHGLLLQTRYQLTPEQWSGLLRGGFLKAAFAWLAFAVSIKLFAFLLLRPLEGKARIAAWSCLVIVLVPITLVVLPKNAYGNRGGSGGSGDPPGRLSASIQAQLPKVTEFIGEWNEPSPVMVPRARLFLSVPLDGSPQSSLPGMRLAKISASAKGQHTEINVFFESPDSATFSALRKIENPILLYNNGMAATCLNHMHYDYSAGSSYLPIRGLTLKALFFSPACLPENRNVIPSSFKPSHLLFFVEDPEAPEFPAPLDQLAADPASPAPPLVIPTTDHEDFELAIRQLIDSLVGHPRYLVEPLITADQLPPAALQPILDYHPWHDRTWHVLVHPFLKAHVSEKDKAILLERLALDPRLTGLFIEKNWTSDAIPVLSLRAEQGLDLDAVSLRLLVEQADPKLSESLAKLAIRLPKGIEKLAPILRDSPDFDWPAFVADGWRSRKYGESNYRREGWLYASWAAELGDRSALRHLAEQAARGKKWERQQLAKLIPSAPPVLVPFLRKSLSDLDYRPTTQTWELP